MPQFDSRNSPASKRARTDGNRREDDWTCPSCGNVNFSFRTTCNMRNCTQPRPADHNSSLQNGGENKGCGEMNWLRFKKLCELADGYMILYHNQKSAAKPLQAPPGYSSSAPFVGSTVPSSMYFGMPPYGSSLFNGSSILPYDVPFSGRIAYHHDFGSHLSAGSPHGPLLLPGPTPYSSGSMMGNGGMYALPPLVDRFGSGIPMGPGPLGLRPGFFPEENSPRRSTDTTRDDDWKCPKCGNINFSFRTVCNMRKCNTQKPGSQVSKSDKHSRQNMAEGSWKCEKCNNVNYPFRTKCNRQNCGAEKPSESSKSRSPASDQNDQ